ncbi:hypothetical protein [Flavobacterium sp. TSSA_36]|uniref:hypothetical protein n=1 Tax=Flavobacterium sp. TSSA_36 TaxID=3447669 RepID=UPI003F310F99
MKIWLTLFIQSSMAMQIHAQTKKEVILNGKIIAPTIEAEEIFIKNESTNQTITSNKDGAFTLACNVGDILEFSAMNLETVRKKITSNEFQNERISVEMTAKTITLQEVIINNNAISAEKLGIIKQNQKKYTPAERRLKTAGDFKPIHLLGLLGGSLAVDPILNKISGRTKNLKKELEIEKKERLLEQLKALYSNKYYEENLNLPRLYVDAFRYFCIEDKNFVSYYISGNKKLLELLLSELAVNFNKKQN